MNPFAKVTCYFEPSKINIMEKNLIKKKFENYIIQAYLM